MEIRNCGGFNPNQHISNKKVHFSGNMETEIVSNTPFLQLKQAVRPNQNPWAYAHRPNAKSAVVIMPIVKQKVEDSGKVEDCVIFLENLRPPLEEYTPAGTVRKENEGNCIEPVAGLVGDIQKNETVMEAANKELEEEAGYVAKDVKIVAENCASSPGCTSERFHVAIAEGLSKTTEPQNDGGIIRNRHIVPIRKAMAWLKEQAEKGKSVSGQAYTGMAFLLDRILNNTAGKSDISSSN